MSRETSTFLGFYRRLGASRAEAEDLVQEVFLKLFRHAETYEPSGRFSAFAFRVARNAWIDHRRRGATNPIEGLGGSGAQELDRSGREEALRLEPAREEEPGVAFGRREEVGRLRSALQELSASHRLVFELGVIQELPYADIAGMLEIPIGTVKSRMFHAVRKLRAALGEETHER